MLLLTLWELEYFLRDKLDGAVVALSGHKKRTCVHTQVLENTEVPEVGLEPTRPCGHWILNPARLPIPPLWLVGN